MPTFNPTNLTGKTGTIQTWTVPFTANWNIEVWGAQGSGDLGGFGAHVKATINLTAGQQLKILVGQQGILGTWQQSATQGAGGGGGGSFVTLNDNTPLVVAGGGGGGGLTGSAIHGTQPAFINASITTSGRNDTTNTNVGGASGAGGGSSASTATYSGGGGGGLTGNGTAGTHNVRETDTYGRSFTNGGQGGTGGTAGGGSPGYGGDGGFGGGGGGTYSCGGGGGYSGGAGKHQSVGTETERRAGGGGGSFIAASATNTLLEIGSRTGAGLVIITPGTAPTLSNLFSGSINPLSDSKITWTYADAESNPQESYQVGWRKQGSGQNHNFVSYDSANAFHIIPAGTLEEGVVYDWALRVKDSNGLWSNYATSQFTSISPYRIETVVNIATETPTFSQLGGATVTNNYSWGGSTWSRVQHSAAGQGARLYVPLAHLINGKTYTVSMTVANAGASSAGIAFDFCDQNSTGHTLAAGEIRRIRFNATRSTYDNIYRFVDVHGPSGSDILLKDVVVSPGADKSGHYFNGDTADTSSTTYRWLGTAGASPSVKEVFGLINRVRDPKPVATTWYSGNSTMIIEGDAIKVTTPAAGTFSSFLPWGVDQLVPSYKGDRVEARFLYKGPGDRSAIWHICDSAGNIVQQHVVVLPSSPSAYTEVVCAGTNTTDNAMSARFVQLCYGNGATGASAPHYFKNIMVHEVNRTGRYFDGSHVNSGLGLQEWVGEVNNSSSIKTTTSGVIKNLIPGDAETSGYGGGHGAWNWSTAVIASGGYSGGKFARMTATAATQTGGMYIYNIWGVEAGESYTMTARMRASVSGSGWRIGAEWRRLDGSMISAPTSSTTVLAANAWTEVGGVLVAPEGAYGVTFTIYTTTGNMASGAYVDIDEPFMALSRDGIKLNYFDGNTTDTSAYQYNWEGAAGTSTSIRSGEFWIETPERIYNQIVNPSAIGGTTGIRNGPSFNPANLAISSVAVSALEGVTTALNVSVTAGDSGWGHYVSYNTLENLPAGTKGKLRFQARGVSGSYSTIGWALTNDPATATVATFSNVTLTSSWQIFEQSFTLSGAMTAGSQFARFIVGNGNLTQVIQVTGIELIPETNVDASPLTKGDYEFLVAAQDSDGVWGDWGAAETFTLGPATNIKTKSAGTFVDTVRMVRQGGVWVPAAVTKTKQGGTFI